MPQRRISELSQICTTWGTRGTHSCSIARESDEDQNLQKALGQAGEVWSWEVLQDSVLTWTSAASTSPMLSISAPSDQLSLPAENIAGHPSNPTRALGPLQGWGCGARLLPSWALTCTVPTWRGLRCVVHLRCREIICVLPAKTNRSAIAPIQAALPAIPPCNS